MASKLFLKENTTCYQAALLPFCLGDEWKKARSFYTLSPSAYFRAFSEKKKKNTWSQVKKRRTAYLWRWPSRPCFPQTTFFVNMSRILLDKRRNLFENISRPFWKQNIVLYLLFDVQCHGHVICSLVVWTTKFTSLVRQTLFYFWEDLFQKFNKITTLVYKLLHFLLESKTMYILIFFILNHDNRTATFLLHESRQLRDWLRLILSTRTLLTQKGDCNS